MAPTVNFRKRTRESKGYNLRKRSATPVPSGERQLKRARQAETKSVRKKPASTARYSVLNGTHTESSKEVPKQVVDRDSM